MQEEFCSGVKLLLERMETNPEEFVYGSIDDWSSGGLENSRWYNYIPTRNINEIDGDEYGVQTPEFYLTKEEREALLSKVAKLYRDRYSGLVMTELMVTKPKRKR